MEFLGVTEMKHSGTWSLCVIAFYHEQAGACSLTSVNHLLEKVVTNFVWLQYINFATLKSSDGVSIPLCKS